MRRRKPALTGTTVTGTMARLEAAARDLEKAAGDFAEATRVAPAPLLGIRPLPVPSHSR